MVKKIFILFLVLVAFCSVCYAHDDTIENISISVSIDVNGDALFKEVWTVSSDDRSEYHKIYNAINDYEIVDFSVTDELNNVYSFIPNWDSASNTEKLGKCGIITSDDRYELCWSVFGHGFHEFTLEYKVTNFVKQYKNSQVVNFNLIESGISPVPYSIDVDINSNYIDSNTFLTTSGFNGDGSKENGKIELKTTKELAYGQYMNVLINFPNNNFSTSASVNDTFEKAFNIKVENNYLIYID